MKKRGQHDHLVLRNEWEKKKERTSGKSLNKVNESKWRFESWKMLLSVVVAVGGRSASDGPWTPGLVITVT